MSKKERKSDYDLEILEAQFEIAQLRWEGSDKIVPQPIEEPKVKRKPIDTP
jgi:hypothetical protein